MKTKKVFQSFVIVVFLGMGVYFAQPYYARFQKNAQERLLSEARKNAWQDLQRNIEAAIGQFQGEAGIVIKDLQAGFEFSHQNAKLFPSASLAKMPLMAACFLAADQGKVKLDRNIALKPADKLTGSGFLKDMPAGTTFSVERLIGLMIYDSDNTATHIVTNLVGMDYLNDAFKGFGLSHTGLSRKIADYQARDKGLENYTTAKDMGFLLEKIYRRELGNQKISDQCIHMLKLTRTNDRIPKYLPAELTIAHKTGLERGVCHDAGIVYTPKGDFVIVVLTGHAHPDSVAAKEFIAKISLYVYNYFEQF